MDIEHSHSRNSSTSGSLPSQKYSRNLSVPRRNVGDKVLITSLSKVYINHNNESNDTISLTAEINDNDFDKIDYETVSSSIRNSKDLPKFKNRIFEDSLESQEVSFYIGDNHDEETAEYENVSYDSFESDDESEFYNDEVRLRENIADNPLPPEPPSSDSKFTENFKKFKKNFSRDITKSLRRISQRMSQVEPDTRVKEEVVSTVTNSEDGKSDGGSVKSGNFLTKIRRSMSLSAVSVANLVNYFEVPPNQKKSTFYLTEIDIDDTENSVGKDDKDDVNRLNTTDQLKSKLSRPKMPPPPVPFDITGKQISKNHGNLKSLYSEAGLFKNKRLETRHNRTSWYAEIGLYPKTPPEDIITDALTNGGRKDYVAEVANQTNLEEKPVFSSVIKELNFKLCKNNEDLNELENEITYNNQSLTSFNSTDSKEDSSVTYAEKNSKFLVDEPLYQFYEPTSISDGDTSDFEHDTYEDIEEINENYVSSVEALDMTNENRNNFSFTRSLWCDTPEVIKSAVLSKLSAQQKKLQEAKFEVITSEASYLNSLNVLCDHFESNLMQSSIVNEEDMDILFQKVKAVKSSSRKIMQDLEKCWKKNILLNGICDIIQRHAEENFNVYIPYCENQVILSDILNRMKEQPAFSELLMQLESSNSCHFLSFHSFLMLPMQRITRWPLLVDAILKRLSEADAEYATCQYALTTLNKIVNQCNEAARRKDQEIELKRISQSVGFSKGMPPIEIDKSERWLLKSGSVTSFQPRNGDTQMTLGKRFNKVPLNLILFNDLFLVTKKKSDKSYTIVHYCPRNMIELRSVDMFPTILKKEAQDKKNNLLYLSILENQEGKTVELLLSSSTESDKERWIEAFSPPKSENPDETLYECWDCPQVKAVHNYNSCQPDELSLSKGDVINVLRKMNDGWYHGERLRDGQTGWFPANYTAEIVNPHVRARNLKQRYRLLTFSEKYLNSNEVL